MKTSETESKPKTPARPSDPMLSCTVLVGKTRIREVLKAKGAKVRLPRSQAEALASLNPPRIRIDGV